MKAEIIQAVRCAECQKLIEVTKEFIYAHNIRLDQQYNKDSKTTKVNLVDEVFCNSECVTEFIKDKIEDIS